MKNQREMIEALLTGEKLIQKDLSSSSIIKMDERGITTYMHGNECNMNEIRSPEFWRIHKKPKWYENIPDGGVLCWVKSEGEEYQIVPTLIFDYPLEVAADLSVVYENYKPLTKQEIQVFMDNAPEVKG